MTIVVPMLLRNLAELGSELPWPTRILKFLSDSLLIHGWWIGIIIAATMGMLAFWLRTEAGKMGVSRLLLRLPVIGMLVQKQAIGRIALVVACLLRSGVELVEALAIAANSCNNMVIRNAILQSNADLQKGIALKESFGRHAVFPASVVQVLVLGQQSGQIEKMLQRLGTDYDKQASFLASRIASVTEPILILLLSVVVGFILFATVLPILEAGNVLIN
jgi:type II secretory pathway component PulF